MKYALLITAILASLASGVASDQDGAEIRGPEVHPGYPDGFKSAFKLCDDTSPDGKFGIIYPRGFAVYMADFVVGLRPFRILEKIQTDEPYFENENHGGISITWLPDGSAGLVHLEGKWGPRAEILLELHDGKVIRQTDLVAEVHKLLLPDYRRAKPEPYNDVVDFILETIGDHDFKLQKGLVSIACDATTDPKGLSGKAWHAGVEATWDIGQGQFTAKKITRLKKEQ